MSKLKLFEATKKHQTNKDFCPFIMFSDGYFVVNDHSFQIVISDSGNVIN